MHSTEFVEIKALLQNIQPGHGEPATVGILAAENPLYPDEHTLSTAASCTLFTKVENEARLTLLPVPLKPSIRGLGEAR